MFHSLLIILALHSLLSNTVKLNVTANANVIVL